MKVFVQCLAQHSHTPHCHSCPVGFTISVNTLAATETFSELSPCAYPPTNRAFPGVYSNLLRRPLSWGRVNANEQGSDSQEDQPVAGLGPRSAKTILLSLVLSFQL